MADRAPIVQSSVTTAVGDFPEGKVTKFLNATILRDHQIVTGDLWIQSGKIIDPFDRFLRARSLKEYAAHREYDCRGLLIIPGFIDIQINGAFGCDFSEKAENDDGLAMVARRLPEHGVTAFCPTVITSSPESYRAILPLLKSRSGGKGRGASVLGTHLEGPFISKVKQGAHPIELIREPGARGFDEIADVYGFSTETPLRSQVAIITMAPEVEGGMAAIRELANRGVVVSAGHSMAGIDVGEAAVRSGVRLVTHLFNAMGQFHHRDPGLLGLLGAPTSTSFYSLICDGHHVHPYSVNIAYRCRPAGAVLVTDAIAALGLPEGRCRLGEVDVEISNNMARVWGRPDTLAGAICPMNACVRNFMRFTGCSLVEAVEAATLHPAQVLGLEGVKGTLAFGADADFVLVDADLAVHEAWVAGHRVYPPADRTVAAAGRSSDGGSGSTASIPQLRVIVPPRTPAPFVGPTELWSP